MLANTLSAPKSSIHNRYASPPPPPPQPLPVTRFSSRSSTGKWPVTIVSAASPNSSPLSSLDSSSPSRARVSPDHSELLGSVASHRRWCNGLPFDSSFNVLMESKGRKKKSSSSNSLHYEAPLGYIIEDVRPHGGIKKFQSAAHSNFARKPS